MAEERAMKQVIKYNPETEQKHRCDSGPTGRCHGAPQLGTALASCPLSLLGHPTSTRLLSGLLLRTITGWGGPSPRWAPACSRGLPEQLPLTSPFYELSRVMGASQSLFRILRSLTFIIDPIFHIKKLEALGGDGVC